MYNLLTLYNPYYQKDVIEQHLELLKEEGNVAFGKVRSKHRDYDHPHQQILDTIYASVSKNTPMQLFLTDYSSMYVANVIEVSENTGVKKPSYYDTFEVENWFIFDDLRLIVYKDFELIRDTILSNFIGTDFNGSTYAIYGNQYVYPMQITMKESISYFEKEDEDFKYFTDIFKSDEQLEMRHNLVNFNFGEKRFYNFSPNTQDNLILAEIEYIHNKNNPLYDFSSVIMKYSKAVEIELHRFLRKVFEFIIEQNHILGYYPYQVNGRDYLLKDLLEQKATYGAYNYLLKSPEIKEGINNFILNKNLTHFIIVSIPYYIKTMQDTRNESVHGNSTSLIACNEIREEVMGIGKSGMLTEFDRQAKYIK